MNTLLQEAITKVALLPEEEQNRAAEVLFALARYSTFSHEDDATRTAIAEGVAEAKDGHRVPQGEVDSLLATVWS